MKVIEASVGKNKLYTPMISESIKDRNTIVLDGFNAPFFEYIKENNTEDEWGRLHIVPTDFVKLPSDRLIELLLGVLSHVEDICVGNPVVYVLSPLKEVDIKFLLGLEQALNIDIVVTRQLPASEYGSEPRIVEY